MAYSIIFCVLLALRCYSIMLCNNFIMKFQKLLKTLSKGQDTAIKFTKISKKCSISVGIVSPDEN